MGAPHQALLMAGGIGTYASTLAADSPDAYWKLDETSGTSFADSSGNGRTATSSGTLTHAQTALFAASAFSAQFTQANTAYLNAAGTWQNAVTGGLTVEAWIKPTLLTSNFSVCGAGVSGADWSWAVYVSAAGQVVFNVVTNVPSFSTAVSCVTSAGVIAINTTYHVVARWTETVGSKIFVDGSLAATTSSVQSSLRSNSDGVFIAREINNLYSQGYIDDVSFYKTPLSDARIAAHYAARNS